jgi:hypothetical protein
MQAVRSVGCAGDVDQDGLSSRLSGRGKQADGVGDDGGRGQRSYRYANDALLQIDDDDGSVRGVKGEFAHDGTFSLRGRMPISS